MKPPPFHYHDPRTVEDTLHLLSELDDAKVIAGGQSLMPMLNMRLAQPGHLVDINRVDGLAGIGWYEPEQVVRIGAATRQRTIEKDPDLARRYPLLPEAISHIGHFQTRNRGTVGGSLAHLDASAELVAVASAAEATLYAASTRAVRAIPMADFPRGHLTTDLTSDELLVAIDVPLWPDGHGYAFEEFARRHGDFALVAAAVLLELDTTHRSIRRCRVSLVGLGPAPIRLTKAEELLNGGVADDDALRSAAALARNLSAVGDDAAPAEYRLALAETLVRRGLRRALRRATQPTTPEVN
ncbi:FAD binding domain-containing protein [Phytoactinopolyspora limicola]|uniref:FAD binding domain-containing protein n=1 Tax=Phytoactinopolyspora limicola TaxID=2715536 RepID=UPI00140965A4|nr:FAD binding domain-containing protein [Phytoactinopolyspora limicola]